MGNGSSAYQILESPSGKNTAGFLPIPDAFEWPLRLLDRYSLSLEQAFSEPFPDPKMSFYRRKQDVLRWVFKVLTLLFFKSFDKNQLGGRSPGSSIGCDPTARRSLVPAQLQLPTHSCPLSPFLARNPIRNKGISLKKRETLTAISPPLAQMNWIFFCPTVQCWLQPLDPHLPRKRGHSSNRVL
ncbi:Hypothetical predicted protein [Podarcis lilfordi]|uniref:Uncharacterized protein n=1 Tax=Podarcis lilfordi TaxID=74358 RepID=A0AA35KTR3_9SAUR|nr:Hypothetical predicted protein [Podarcis lilfordi]